MISFLNALLFIAAATAIGRALLPRQTVAPRSRGEEIACESSEQGEVRKN